jgi:hypothetical protein
MRNVIALMLVVILGHATVGRAKPLRTPLTEAGVKSRAEREAQAAGYDLRRFSIVSIVRHAPDGFDVRFEQTPRAAPGGFFTVYVDATTGKAELIPGK